MKVSGGQAEGNPAAGAPSALKGHAGLGPRLACWVGERRQGPDSPVNPHQESGGLSRQANGRREGGALWMVPALSAPEAQPEQEPESPSGSRQTQSGGSGGRRGKP